MFLSHLADALHRAGRVDEGLAAVAEGFAHTERTQERGFSAELHRLRGELLRLGGNRDAAHETACGWRSTCAPAAAPDRSSCAPRYRSRGWNRARRAEPSRRAELASILDSFTEGHETMDLMAARTLLSEMG